jgi:ubiquinone/menaquinone biosynthesis C-methylase UbiE
MRTSEQIRRHYEVERELASRLRHAPTEKRRRLYGPTYDELFRRISDHPMLVRKVDSTATARAISWQFRLIRRFLTPDATFLEVGPGDCALSFAVAKQVRHVYAVDVSEVISSARTTPENFNLVLSDGVSIPVPPGCVTVAYSNQLMEHLHPDDAQEQLRNIWRSLAPGGVYFCITPSSLSGPHDVSRDFERVAAGFHLKEYTCAELNEVFREVGFSKVRAVLSVKGRSVLAPVWVVSLVESLVRRLPYPMSRNLARRFPLRQLLGVQVVGYR